MAQERAALYARISYDRAGESVGVTRQMKDLRELATARGWQVVAEITDNDISATKGKARPGYDRIWHLVTTGQVEHVVVWQSSRLMRSRKDRAEVISTFGKHAVDIVAAKGPSFDLRSAYGRGQADMVTSFDTMESEVKSERVTAAIKHLASQGRAWGFCPYGWDRSGGNQTVNEHEAAIVRELVDRLLAGESLAELYRDMNRRDEPAPGYAQWGKLTDEQRARREAKGHTEPPRAWAKSTIRTLVRRDANIGVRRYKGQEIKGDWPAIVDPGKHARVVALLGSEQRRSHSGPRPGARKHLLTNGIGKCGVCGGVLRVSNRNGRRDRTRIYMCNDPAKGCTGRQQDKVDELVARVVIGRLAQPDALDWLLGDDEQAQRSAQRCEEIQRRLDDAADSYADGRIDTRQLERITARLTPELEAARHERDAAVRSLDLEVLRPLAGPEAAACWEAMPVTVRRAVLETLGVEVVILPRTKHGPGFEPESVRFDWR
ncbi:recombinase family protein [Mycolicibacterium fortuitum]|uniref:recombinase family protein n=1 Tax=Mycolicibacterium fortuitum TaxID=1766 RepID=UPI0007EBC64C|nr:recombinase family protein [Mycolicibacterium fortuitum]OBG51475.1 recombinase [Mycolicibacterium fortuitum]